MGSNPPLRLALGCALSPPSMSWPMSEMGSATPCISSSRCTEVEVSVAGLRRPRSWGSPGTPVRWGMGVLGSARPPGGCCRRPYSSRSGMDLPEAWASGG